MPELPEVETVRRGLAPSMAGAMIERVELRRPDLRFPFPNGFSQRLEGNRILSVDRRGKYLTLPLSTGETLIMHLGMSGRFLVSGERAPGRFYHASAGDVAHTHVRFTLQIPAEGRGHVAYADPRRFGFMDLVASGELATCRHFAQMGPEPLSEAFTPDHLVAEARGRRTPLKSFLLDQSTVAGLGNIYVCEALWRARLSPRRLAASLGPKRATRLVAAIQDALEDAIEAGGSTLRDYHAADGAMGYFQHRFDVYDREGEPCRQCGRSISRFAQSGRSTFSCTTCQR
ncbi:formamidopyrimidine-DNA glycosylase [Parvularcula bermudensis HTCC2503]|uniref:Formamidopyrimidine-DNA glycosylase n=1 Tax=Parvularcula bermudensis (strain ATCC BAA-594 / HTCC2503 / KCTC 12087) TaxID=314260 RepID=E0TBK0_PARBH|nr:formamidopyrimidine-DNA glycosylase [Parvularcula bermudensis HTCC2503]